MVSCLRLGWRLRSLTTSIYALHPAVYCAQFATQQTTHRLTPVITLTLTHGHSLVWYRYGLAFAARLGAL